MCSNAVQLSDIYDAFDAPTRKAFQQWQQQFAVAIKGNDQNLNDTLGNLPTFAADATDILRVLDVEHNSVQSLVRNGSTVFAALSKDQSALRNLITSAHTTFTTTAQNNNVHRRHLPRVPDVPGRDQGDDGAAADASPPTPTR